MAREYRPLNGGELVTEDSALRVRREAHVEIEEVGWIFKSWAVVRYLDPPLRMADGTERPLSRRLGEFEDLQSAEAFLVRWRNNEVDFA